MSTQRTVSTAHIFAAAVEIGEALPPAARPFYVAFIEPFSRLDDGSLWVEIGLAIGVNELSDLACLLALWAKARTSNELATCTAIEAQLKAAGVAGLVRLAGEACGRLPARVTGCRNDAG